jgi:uncharacterized protein CbrC (UPF0167 family)
MSKKEEALDVFIGKVGEIKERLDELQAFVENHLNFDSEEINWSHVGTASRYLAQLTELTDQAYERGEYSKEENS